MQEDRIVIRRQDRRDSEVEACGIGAHLARAPCVRVHVHVRMHKLR